MKLIRLTILTLALTATALTAAEGTAEREPARSQPAAVPNFALLDARGRHHELHRADASNAVVLFIAGNGCPIVRQSISKVRALRSRFGTNGVAFWMLNANPQDDTKSIAEEAEQFRIGSIPILKDELQLVSRALGVTRTAEAIAISTKDWTVIYRGAIDDQLSEGAKKPQPTERYLEAALTEFLAGKPVSKPKTAVKGCLIEFEDGTRVVSSRNAVRRAA